MCGNRFKNEPKEASKEERRGDGKMIFKVRGEKAFLN